MLADEVSVSVGEKPMLASRLTRYSCRWAKSPLWRTPEVSLSVCEWRVQLDGMSSGQKKSGIHGGTMAIDVHTRRMVDASRRGLRDGNAGGSV